MTPTPSCPGHRRTVDGARPGLCLLCARCSDSKGPAIEPAARTVTRGGTWGCVNFLPLAPALA